MYDCVCNYKFLIFWWGRSICFEYGIYNKYFLYEKLWEGGGKGRGGKGWDIVFGIKDLIMLDLKVGLKI